jgi:hypothetical protein
MASVEKIPRPHKKTPYTLYFATGRATKGWRDVQAVRASDLVKAWDFLSHTPLDTTPHSYPLKGALQAVTWKGVTHQRWQFKPSLTAGIRIWYFVEGKNVCVETVHTHHPNETK